ncbi:hypothetical protein Namu_3480 [Nakamurella multipartita DSM 44233]|uniref:Uncharacterized protein n=2 Tax=Nakamurella TaxID=53460 RepID=C8XEQ4_NAKMY|nr:hypothetical protein Namu_3480 [Nakamurella multipartita DSM 44233]
MMRQVFPDGPTDHDPLGSAFIWKRELCSPDGNRQEVLRLTYRPDLWQLDDVAPAIYSWGIASEVIESNYPDRIAYVKLLPISAPAVRAYAEATLSNYRLLVMVKRGGIWKAWAVSDVGTTSVDTNRIIEILDQDEES